MLSLLQEMRHSGSMGERLHAATLQWLQPVPYANPGMFEPYAQKDHGLDPALPPWAGEFPGKYLVGAIRVYRMHREPRLRSVIEYALFRLYALQGEDGYLGIYPEAQRFQPVQEGEAPRWELWDISFAMLALYLWEETTGSLQAQERCLRAANYLCGQFLEGDRSLEALGAPGPNSAPLHVFALLYARHKEERYLRMCQLLLESMTHHGDYVRNALKGVPYDQMANCNLQALSGLQGLLPLYQATGEENLKTAAFNLYRGLRARERRVTGGLLCGDQANASPFAAGPLLTDAAAAWAGLMAYILRDAPQVQLADELELTTWNALLGGLHPSGRFFFADVPMSGRRQTASFCGQDTSIPGAPDLTAAATGGMLGLGLVGRWGAFAQENDVYLNFYGASSTVLQLSSGRQVHITQKTEYPIDGAIYLTVTCQRPIRLLLRIPSWSRSVQLRMGETIYHDMERGAYYPLSIPQGTVQIELTLDMRLHFHGGEGEVQTRTALFRGPLLLCYDRHFNRDGDPSHPPVLEAESLSYQLEQCEDYNTPLLLCRFTAKDGSPVLLCDFATAGACGTPYTVWLPIRHAPLGGAWR